MRLFKDYSSEFNDLLATVDAVKSRVQNDSDRDLIKLQSLEEEIKELKIQSTMMTKELIEIKQLLMDKEPTGLVEEEIEVDDKEVNDKAVYYGGLEISKTCSKDFRYTDIDDATFKFKYTDKRNRTASSSFSIFDVWLLMNIEKENTWKTWNDLTRITSMQPMSLRKIAYNIKKGFFEKFDCTNLLSFSKEYGLLYINGKKTNVPIKTVRYIVDCMVNSNSPATTLCKLKKTGECSNLMYNIIGTNYTNPRLTMLLRDFRNVTVENNPQKRKEMGI